MRAQPTSVRTKLYGRHLIAIGEHVGQVENNISYLFTYVKNNFINVTFTDKVGLHQS